MRILTYTVTPEEDGRMVKGILRGSLQLSYTLLKSLKWRENAILLNGQSVHVNTIVHAGDTVSVDFDTGVITDETTGKTYQAAPLPAFVQGIVDNGGLLKSLKARGAAK